jgi:Holliday junction resolvasome RuvABC endonuclease subunit
MIVLGVDLSMTSPALCLFKGTDFSYTTCNFFFLTSMEKFLYMHPKIHGEMFPEYNIDSERFNNIGTWIVDVCKTHEVENVFIEDYSYGSKGRVFHIAENGGVCKYLLWKNNIKYEAIPPTVIKKFATGKGNADKQKMQDAFIEETQHNIKQTLRMTDKQWNPSSDIVDSYFICKYGVSELQKQEQQ